MKNEAGFTALIIATKSGQHNIVDDLLKAGANPDETDSNGYSALYHACASGDMISMEMLVDEGADILHVAYNGDSVVYGCRASGNMQALRWMQRLIEEQEAHRHPDPESEDFHADSIIESLFHAARINDVKQIQDLIEIDKVDPNVEDNSGWTALTIASYEGKIESINTLVKFGADVNKAERDGWTPLMFAANKGRPTTIQRLLELGADPARVTVHGNYAHEIALANRHHTMHTVIASTGLNKAIQERHVPNILVFLQAGISPEDTELLAKMKLSYEDTYAFDMALLNATVRNDTILVKTLIRIGVNIHAEDSTGWTALAHAASRGYYELSKLFIDGGVAIDKPEKDGWSPLMFAANNGDIETVKLLLDHGADVHHTSRFGLTAHKLSVAADHKEVTELLERSMTPAEVKETRASEVHEMDMTYSYGYGYYSSDSLFTAVVNGHSQEVQALLEEGYDIDDIDAQGWTPAAYAASSGDIRVLEVLIAAGADINKPENDGWTPLAFAADSGHILACELLMVHGADPFALTSSGHMAHEIAKTTGHETTALAIVEIGLAKALRLEDVSKMVQMIEAGAAPDIVDERGISALISAVNHKNESAVARILGSGANVDQAEQEGWTPLIFASFNGDLIIATMLIDAGADCNLKNFHGHTALQFAQDRRFHDVADLVRECMKEDRSIKTKQSKTDLESALEGRKRKHDQWRAQKLKEAEAKAKAEIPKDELESMAEDIANLQQPQPLDKRAREEDAEMTQEEEKASKELQKILLEEERERRHQEVVKQRQEEERKATAAKALAGAKKKQESRKRRQTISTEPMTKEEMEKRAALDEYQKVAKARAHKERSNRQKKKTSTFGSMFSSIFG
eukprot:CAMPEP_0182427004 /NCGR_PEP_ID=MMETSP1167-20130531/13516_1 /TAXON_ID=2988 /ORGANISM="Mallomonas Sp, Strain CCMP3275" /LENGTH=860 /DNA_ID=CAMNT_0024608809 /DNA_START=373 /DNA_END=2955 /DNA_ORIENTATION=-